MAKTRSEYYTRTRLLNQLGLFQQQQQQQQQQQTSTSTKRQSKAALQCTTSEYQPSVLGSVIPFETKLNDSYDDNNTGSSPCPSFVSSPHSSFASDNPSDHHIHFKDTVSVIPIPSRYQYSDRIKQCMWSNRIELREMAQRNLIEFESEGFDWRNVVVEEDMYIDAANGRLVHPCHVDGSLPKISTKDDNHFEQEQHQHQHHHHHQHEVEVDDEDEDDNIYFFTPLQRQESFNYA